MTVGELRDVLAVLPEGVFVSTTREGDILRVKVSGRLSYPGRDCWGLDSPSRKYQGPPQPVITVSID